MAGELIPSTTDEGFRAISAVEQHFNEATAKVKKLAAAKPAKGKGGAK